MATVRKRKWNAPDGSEKEAWIVSYTDRAGKRRQQTFEKKKDADKARLKIETEMEAGTHVAASQAKTVKEVAELFLRFNEERAKDGRIGYAHYGNLKKIVDRSINPHIGYILISELEPEDVNTFYQAMLRVDGLRPVTARDRLTTLGQIEDFAFRRKMTRVRTVPSALKDFRGLAQKQVRVPSTDEIHRLLVETEKRGKWVAPRSRDMLRCYVHLATFCGLRWGEITGLTLKHVDLDAGVLRIRHSMSEIDGLKAPKTRSGLRDLPLPTHLLAILWEWIVRHHLPNDDDLLFTAVTGSPIRISNFHKLLWHPLLKRAGIYSADDNLHFHALRHFAASWMVQQGVPLPETASLLGHRTFNTTLQTYTHSLVGGTKRADLLEGLARQLLAAPLTIDAATP